MASDFIFFRLKLFPNFLTPPPLGGLRNMWTVPNMFYSPIKIALIREGEPFVEKPRKPEQL